MIPKAELLAVAEEAGLLATTVEKDYALGWVLFGIADNPDFREWSFKGGTCLKKCYFDTYRFSEDLDFTLPAGAQHSTDSIRTALGALGEWVRDRVGLEFPGDGVEVNESINKRGNRTWEGRMTYTGPLQLARAQRQRIRFDLTQDEVLVDPPVMREVFHGYSDLPNPQPKVRCYSLAEVLAEKVRALFERSGRARDVYDVVNLGRNLYSELRPEQVRSLVERKFEFKTLERPSVATILSRIHPEVLATDWNNSLRHQLQVLPPAHEFLAGLEEVLGWLLGVDRPVQTLSPIAGAPEEATVPRRHFASAAQPLGRGVPVQAAPSSQVGYGAKIERLRFAARNRLLARVAYHGTSRLIEPYSLRMPSTGNLLLYVFEVERGSENGQGVKSFKVDEIGDVQITDRAFKARYLVEL